MIERNLQKQLMAEIESPEAIIVTGMRRVGKTTLLSHIYESLETKNKVFLDLENPLNRSYFEEENYDAIVRNLAVLGVSTTQTAYVFLDEIQYVRSIPSVVKYLMDNYHIKFFLTGSASFYLKHLFSESLAGRKKIFELFPFSFDEFLRFKAPHLHIPTRQIISEAVFNTIEPWYAEYVQYGGFPAVVSKETGPEKDAMLQEIFSSYINKEVLVLSDFRKNNVLRDLMLLLMSRIGSRVEIQKLSVLLGISRVTVQEYLAFLEGTYLFSFISPYSTNRDVELRHAQKVYSIDSGLSRLLGRLDEGHVFENAIFHQFRCQYKDVRYYQRKNGVEIDFVVDGCCAYEVKQHAQTSDFTRLVALSRDTGIDESRVISRRYVGDMDVLYGFQIK